MREQTIAVLPLLFSLMLVARAHAQWTPVVAKSAELTYQISSDGTEVLIREFRGEYFRSKDGSEVTTKIQAGESPEKGRKYLRDARMGNSYAVDFEKRTATVIFKHPLPLLPRTDRDTENHQGHQVIGELKCLGLRIKLNGAYIPGVTWISVPHDLTVKQEVLLPETREVRSLYEIKLVEPDPSVFLIPKDFTIQTNLVRTPSAPQNLVP
jgi:hypothetical protein